MQYNLVDLVVKYVNALNSIDNTEMFDNNSTPIYK